jgi:uncharacterized protein (DUF488 family)
VAIGKQVPRFARDGAQPIFTIGHSTRPIGGFVDLLRQNDVRLVVDVRTVPKSRTNPQYNSDALAASLAEAGIGYTRIAALGGLRPKRRGVDADTNAFWQNQSFHNYADYAMTPAFRDALAELRAISRERRCAVMCSEAVWWRCHRRIIADYLLHEGDEVLHIVGDARVEPAKMTPAATASPHGALTYPPANLPLLENG